VDFQKQTKSLSKDKSIYKTTQTLKRNKQRHDFNRIIN
jgi:hypothetical protein